MNTPTITIPVNEAQQTLNAYAAMPAWVVADPVHQATIAVNQVAARGYRMLSLRECFAAVQPDGDGRPPLAVAPANHTICIVDPDAWGYSFRSSDAISPPRNHKSLPTIRIERDNRWPGEPGYAKVPHVPVHVIPLTNPVTGQPVTANLSEFLILWEVEEDGWQDVPQMAMTARDPFLLFPLDSGPVDLCAIIAEWDLTPLEMYLANRFSR